VTVEVAPVEPVGPVAPRPVAPVIPVAPRPVAPVAPVNPPAGIKKAVKYVCAPVAEPLIFTAAGDPLKAERDT
jgi:hypothetical protein